MKKIALFIAIVMSIMTLSFVFASEEDVLLVAPAAEDESADVTLEDGEGAEPIEITAEEGEIVDGEGEDIAAAPEEETTTGTPTVISANDTTDDSTNTKSNKTIVGAIIAIVIVVVVIALAALVQKK